MPTSTAIPFDHQALLQASESEMYRSSIHYPLYFRKEFLLEYLFIFQNPPRYVIRLSFSLPQFAKFVEVLALVLLFFIQNAFGKFVSWRRKYHPLKPFLEIRIGFIIFIFVILIHVLAFLKLLRFLIWILFNLKNLHQKYPWNLISDSCFLLFFLFDFVYFLIFKLIFELLH